MLLSYECKLVAHYITQSNVIRGEILNNAMRDPKVSGPLIKAYRTVDTLLAGSGIRRRIVLCHTNKKSTNLYG